MRNKRTKANKVMTFGESRAYSIGASNLTADQKATRYAGLLLNPAIRDSVVSPMRR